LRIEGSARAARLVPTVLTALLLATPAAASTTEPPAAPCTAEQAWPPRLAMEFVVQASRGVLGLEGINELSFVVEGTSYRMRSSTRSLLVSAQQASRGSVEGRVLRPEEYVEQNLRRGPATTTIDWAAQRVQFSANRDAPARTLPLLQDRLTLLLQLGERLRSAQGDGEIEVPVAGLRQVSPYRFKRRGSEAVNVPAGTFATVHLERLSDSGGAMEVWLAPSLCWLPVQLRYTDERGLVVENRLRRVSFD
jgi:hypothetical protein